MQALLLLAFGARFVLAQSATELFAFNDTIDIENIALRLNGHLLLTTFYQGHLYTLDPFQAAPEAELVAALPGATALCGIAPIGDDKFAVVGGVRGSYHYDNETVYTIDFGQDAADPVIEQVARLPDASMLNGMASLPAQPHIILIGDARLGCIFRVDTTTGISKVVFADDAMTAPANASIPIGINGLKVTEDHVFFTNSARNIFAKAPMSADGETFGEVEIVAQLESSTAGTDWDDFVLSSDGVAYAAQPENALARIFPNGTVSTFAGGGNSSAFTGPTSVQITKDERTLYVTTRSGQVVAVDIES